MPLDLPPPDTAQAQVAYYDAIDPLLVRARAFWALPGGAPDPAGCATLQASVDPESNEIVVCGATGEQYLIGQRLPRPPTTAEELNAAMRWHLGPATMGPTSGHTEGGSPWVGVGIVVKF